ncbi:M24 family metallopeptidase [Staphylococcus aureus]
MDKYSLHNALSIICIPKCCLPSFFCMRAPEAQNLQSFTLSQISDGTDRSTVDISTFHRGFHGDLNETFFVGDVDEKAKTLVRVTHECLEKAISIGKFSHLR